MIPGIITGTMLSFARSLGEFGATISFVSNIPGETQTIPLAMYTFIETPGAEMEAARLCAISIVIAATLGIVVDDTIHFMSKYLRARRDEGLEAAAAVKYAFSTVGVALWTTSVALTAGFLVLATSPFMPNAEMGFLVAIVIMFALVVDFLLLPALLIRYDRFFMKGFKSA